MMPALHAPDERPALHAGQPLLWLCDAGSADPRDAGRRHLRQILADYLGVADARISFEAGRAPRVETRWRGLELSLSPSHAGRYALIGLCAGARIGVDMTPIAPWPEMPGLARLYLGPAAEATLAAQPANCRARVFAHLWAEMEARGKCLGVGLQERAPDHHQQFEQAPLRFYRTEHEGHAIVLAVEAC